MATDHFMSRRTGSSRHCVQGQAVAYAPRRCLTGPGVGAVLRGRVLPAEPIVRRNSQLSSRLNSRVAGQCFRVYVFCAE